MHVKQSSSKRLCYIGLASLMALPLSGCGEGGISGWWREVTSEREPQMATGPRRRPMLNHQFDKSKPVVTDEQSYYVPAEQTPPAQTTYTPTPAVTSYPDRPIGSLGNAPQDQYQQQETSTLEQIGSWFSSETQPTLPPPAYSAHTQPSYSAAPVTMMSAGHMARLAPAAGEIPSPMERKPIASNPDAHRTQSEMVLASIGGSNAEYPALSSVPQTPAQFETVRAEHPSVKQELMQGKQLSDAARQELYQHIANESDEALSEAFSQRGQQALTSAPKVPVAIARTTKPTPVETPPVKTHVQAPAQQVIPQPAPAIAATATPAPQAFVKPNEPSVEYGQSELTASVDQALVPPPMQAEPQPVAVAAQPAASAPVNVFVQAPITSNQPGGYAQNIYQGEAGGYVPVVPTHRYTPVRSRGSGYLPDSRY